jgi:hypothetical protein
MPSWFNAHINTAHAVKLPHTGFHEQRVDHNRQICRIKDYIQRDGSSNWFPHLLAAAFQC